MKYAIVDTVPVSTRLHTGGYVCFDRSALFTLAHNLAVAGALERAWQLGTDGAHWACPYSWEPNTRGEQAP